MNAHSIRLARRAAGLATASAAVAIAGAIGAMPQAAAECTNTDVNGSATISCAPTPVPNTSTEDNLTEQEVAQPGWN